jgi:hypothetical protein
LCGFDSSASKLESVIHSISYSRPAAIYEHGVERAGWIDGIHVASLDLRPPGAARAGVAFAKAAIVLEDGAAMVARSKGLVLGAAGGERDALDVG